TSFPRLALTFRIKIDSFLREKCCRARELRPGAVCVLGQSHELCKVGCRVLPIARSLGRTSCAVEATVTVGILLERRLELAQRWSRLTHLQQEFGEQLAHRIEAVLHRHMLDARDRKSKPLNCSHERASYAAFGGKIRDR